MRRWAPITTMLLLLPLASGVACTEKRAEPLLEIDVDPGSSKPETEHSDQTQQSDRPEQPAQAGTQDAGTPRSELPQCNTAPPPQAVPQLQVKQVRHDLGGIETVLEGQKASFSGRVVGQGAGYLQIEGSTVSAESYYPPGYSTVPGAVADAGSLTERWTVMGPSEIGAVPAPIGTEVEVVVDLGTYSAYRQTPDMSLVVRSGEQVLLLYVREDVYSDNAIGEGGFILSKGAHTCVSADECWYTYEDELVVRSEGTKVALAPGETRTFGDYRVWGRAGSFDDVPGAYSLQSCNDYTGPPIEFTAILQPDGG